MPASAGGHRSPPEAAVHHPWINAVTALSGARVLVTGGSGLIGRNVVDLIDRDADVHAVSRTPRAGRRGLRWWVRDLSEPGASRQLIASVRPDIVIHLAGAVRGDRSLDAVEPTLRANLMATVELLEASTRSDCRRIVVSGSLLEEPSDDALQPVPPSPYGASRWAATAYARMFHALFEAPVVILRPSFAYGPGQEPTKLVPYVITTLLAGDSPTLSSGERLIDFVYAADVAQAYLAAATAPGIDGKTIDIGCGRLVSVRDVVEELVRIVGPTERQPLFGARPIRPLEQEVEVKADDAASLLDWRATTSLPEGLRQTVEWFRAQALTAPDSL
jgi:nucleoside-diphosphate-sugar epimerase